MVRTSGFHPDNRGSTPLGAAIYFLIKMIGEYYQKVAFAQDLSNKRDRLVYRLLEIFPGALSWATIFLAFLFSWLYPKPTAIVFILYIVVWFLRTVYFSFHLKSGFKRMQDNEKIDWLKRLRDEKTNTGSQKIKNWEDIYHLIVLPMYKEPLEIVQSSFKSLLQSVYPKDKFIVVLACEERAGDTVKKTAEVITEEFSDKFFKLLVTFHPANVPGEIAGKASNETWAVKKAKEKIIDPLNIPYENIIFSSFDIDTVVLPQYFGCLTYHYLYTKDPSHTSFQPIPLFMNNAYEAPAISRVFSFSSSFWQIMNQERPEKLITFSSHSMPFKALLDVGYKQTDVVSDDSRIFWQCLLKYNGHYQVEPIYYPVSMDANVAPSFIQTLKNIYKQQRRWAYGVADVPYILFGFIKNKKIKFSKKLSFSLEIIEGHWSWATSSILIFFMGWLPLVLGGHNFSQTVLSYNLPKFTSRILTISMLGLVLSAYFSMLLLPPKKYRRLGHFKHLVWNLGEWILLPLVMIFFSSVPALDAQTHLMLGKYMGFWPTPKMRKNHSK